jgi:hypothetical protein
MKCIYKDLEEYEKTFLSEVIQLVLRFFFCIKGFDIECVNMILIAKSDWEKFQSIQAKVVGFVMEFNEWVYATKVWEDRIKWK